MLYLVPSGRLPSFVYHPIGRIADFVSRIYYDTHLFIRSPSIIYTLLTARPSCFRRRDSYNTSVTSAHNPLSRAELSFSPQNAQDDLLSFSSVSRTPPLPRAPGLSQSANPTIPTDTLQARCHFHTQHHPPRHNRQSQFFNMQDPLGRRGQWHLSWARATDSLQRNDLDSSLQ